MFTHLGLYHYKLWKIPFTVSPTKYCYYDPNPTTYPISEICLASVVFLLPLAASGRQSFE